MPEQNVNPPAEQPISLESAEDEPISLVEGTGAVATFRTIGTAAAADKRADFKRPVNLNGTGATRCKIFRTKLAIASLESMEVQINQWLDSEEIEVKHVSQVIGTVQGKMPEPNVIMTVWY